MDVKYGEVLIQLQQKICWNFSDPSFWNFSDPIVEVNAVVRHFRHPWVLMQIIWQ
jgi:hypothetical protein